MRDRLEDYVRARNNRRSCAAAANGFVSGKRIYALKNAEHAEHAALIALADWAEARARAELGLPPTPDAGR